MIDDLLPTPQQLELQRGILALDSQLQQQFDNTTLGDAARRMNYHTADILTSEDQSDQMSERTALAEFTNLFRAHGYFHHTAELMLGGSQDPGFFIELQNERLELLFATNNLDHQKFNDNMRRSAIGHIVSVVKFLEELFPRQPIFKLAALVHDYLKHGMSPEERGMVLLAGHGVASSELAAIIGRALGELLVANNSQVFIGKKLKNHCLQHLRRYCARSSVFMVSVSFRLLLVAKTRSLLLHSSKLLVSNHARMACSCSMRANCANMPGEHSTVGSLVPYTSKAPLQILYRSWKDQMTGNSASVQLQ